MLETCWCGGYLELKKALQTRVSIKSEIPENTWHILVTQQEYGIINVTEVNASSGKLSAFYVNNFGKVFLIDSPDRFKKLIHSEEKQLEILTNWYQTRLAGLGLTTAPLPPPAPPAEVIAEDVAAVPDVISPPPIPMYKRWSCEVPQSEDELILPDPANHTALISSNQS